MFKLKSGCYFIEFSQESKHLDVLYIVQCTLHNGPGDFKKKGKKSMSIRLFEEVKIYDKMHSLFGG